MENGGRGKRKEREESEEQEVYINESCSTSLRTLELCTRLAHGRSGTTLRGARLRRALKKKKKTSRARGLTTHPYHPSSVKTQQCMCALAQVLGPSLLRLQSQKEPSRVKEGLRESKRGKESQRETWSCEEGQREAKRVTER